MQSAHLKRRDFIASLGGAAAWPLVVRAQPGERMRRIGVLTGYVENDAEAQRRVGAFRQKIGELGWTKSHGVEIDYRWYAGDFQRIRVLAGELVALKPNVVLASGEPAVLAVQQENRTIPIVFVQVDDPLGTGLVSSLARPSGNVTGFSPLEFSIGGKMLELLKEAAPHVSRVAVLMRPGSRMHAGSLRAIEAAALSLGVQVTAAGARDAAEIESAIDAFSGAPKGGLIVLSYVLANVNRKKIFERAARHRLPAIYPFRHYVTDGGLISYGVDPADQFRDAAGYVDRILRGEKAGDLPVQAPTRYELVINLRTAKTLGLEIPPMLLGRADEVIE
jgi:putative ABC transport system substrate-binding protein